MTPTSPPSGEQHALVRGDSSAVVVEVGGGLRTYDAGGVAVVDGYPADEMATGGRGQVLAPWPNRLHAGRYAWDGARHEAPQDEPELGNALHGLVRWRAWRADERTDPAEVTVRLRLHPSPAYPFLLDLAVRYALTDDGLLVESTATNAGGVAAPFALGAHPYVTVGGRVDDARLTVPADTRLVVDASQIPTGTEPVEGTAYDFRAPRTIGPLRIDHAFTDLHRDADGRATVRLDGDGRAVEVWVDESFPWLMVFTGDTVPQPERRRLGVAVEPMTAPPNALATGEAVLRLEPGASTTSRWGVRPVR